MSKQWRVSWEMVTPFNRPDLFTNEKWVGPFSLIDETDWHPTENITNEEESARDQYTTLLKWEKDQTQPIRKVKLEYQDETWQEAFDSV